MKLLSATDLLPKSEYAIDRAGLIAATIDADVSLVHVVTPIASERVQELELAQSVAQTKARARPPLWRYAAAPNVIVRVGNPAAVIAELTQDLKAHLVVLGPHRRKGIREALSGSVAQRVLGTRSAPVLVVRKPPRADYQRVLLAMDSSDTSAGAIRAAESLVLMPGSEAIVVHASEPPYQGALMSAGMEEEKIGAFATGWQRMAKEAITDVLQEHSRDFSRYRILVEDARPAKAILHAAELVQPDLLVMGTHSRGLLGQALLGSVANEVLQRVDCDVLIVPRGAMAAYPGQTDRTMHNHESTGMWTAA